ncbi:DUF2254 domain-containing protein [uncultured Algimonas sp.]|uniref:DUF2254 domain-containing protein n=1 Tax=uncultured Algimonas sp. TaxID=1547920 RepID=UPI00262C4A86|nr:DUF2254 domain-containing protein [uncultured Algimonas sp.]
MSAWIIQSLLRLRASYYFIPALMGMAAVGLGVLTTLIDLRYQAEIRDILGWFFASTVTSARSVLTTIAGSMISVAAVTFSLTMVAVTTASGQYGPRLIGNFMRDRANQVTLGMFLATFLYCMVVLKSVSEEIVIDSQSTVGLSPSLSVLVALILTVISVAVLIFFVHHIPETLNVGTITGKVSKGLIGQIELGRFPGGQDLETTNCEPLGNPFDPDLTQTVRSPASGYIQAISLKGMMEWAEEEGYRLRLLKVPGDFVMESDGLVEVMADDSQAAFDTEAFRDEISPEIWSFIATGRERTVHQNLLFLADELVEIASRALSPGVNDPFTAVNCIHWFGHIGLAMINAPAAQDCVLDSSGTPRIWARSVGFESLCATLFGQSRQYICQDENAARETLEVLYHMKRRATEATEPVLDKHIEQLKTAIRESGLGQAQKARLRGGPPFGY